MQEYTGTCVQACFGDDTGITQAPAAPPPRLQEPHPEASRSIYLNPALHLWHLFLCERSFHLRLLKILRLLLPTDPANPVKLPSQPFIPALPFCVGPTEGSSEPFCLCCCSPLWPLVLRLYIFYLIQKGFDFSDFFVHK